MKKIEIRMFEVNSGLGKFQIFIKEKIAGEWKKYGVTEKDLRSDAINVVHKELGGKSASVNEGEGKKVLSIPEDAFQVYSADWAMLRKHNLKNNPHKNSDYKKSLKNLINTHLELLSEYEKELLTVSNKEERKKLLLGMNHSQEQLTDLIQMWHDEHSNILKGGKGDALTVDDVDQNELRMGMMIEMEHTDDKYIALEIVLDHLAEFPDYYTRLLKMEKSAKKNLKSNPEEKKSIGKKVYTSGNMFYETVWPNGQSEGYMYELRGLEGAIETLVAKIGSDRYIKLEGKEKTEKQAIDKFYDYITQQKLKSNPRKTYSDYNYYSINNDGEIISGWSYKQDALDDKKESSLEERGIYEVKKIAHHSRADKEAVKRFNERNGYKGNKPVSED